MKLRLLLQENELNVVKNTFWIFGERFLRSFFLLFISILLARHLGVNDYGVYSYVVAFAGLIMQLNSLGFGGIIVRELIKYTFRSKILFTSFIFRFITSVLLIGVTALFHYVLNPESNNTRLLIIIFASGLAFQSLEVYDLWFQAFEKNKIASVLRLSAIILTFLFTMIGIHKGCGVKYFLYVFAMEFFVIGILYLAYYYLKVDKKIFQFKGSIGLSLLKKSWPLMLSIMGVAIYKKIDQIMIGEFINNSEVGTYAVASKLSEATFLLPIAIMKAIFPRLVKSSISDKNEFNIKMQKLYDLLFAIGVIVALSITLIGPSLINELYGSQYTGATLILNIHIWACIFIYMREALSKWLIIEELYVFSMTTHGVGAIVNIILNLVLIPKYGAIGAAIATIISYSSASYFSLFIHPKTRPAARMMTLAIISPIRYSYKIILKK